jgi:hypothetical protein
MGDMLSATARREAREPVTTTLAAGAVAVSSAKGAAISDWAWAPPHATLSANAIGAFLEKKHWRIVDSLSVNC